MYHFLKIDHLHMAHITDCTWKCYNGTESYIHLLREGQSESSFTSVAGVYEPTN